MKYRELNIDSKVLARLLLTKADEAGVPINATKLQKLLYVLYGYALAKERVRISEEAPAAWPYGPVFPRVQKVNLTDRLTSDDINILKQSGFKEELDIMTGEVLSSFGKYSAMVLSEWSHEPDSPWSKALANSNGGYNIKLNIDDIYEYFCKNILI